VDLDIGRSCDTSESRKNFLGRGFEKPSTAGLAGSEIIGQTSINNGVLLLNAQLANEVEGDDIAINVDVLIQQGGGAVGFHLGSCVALASIAETGEVDKAQDAGLFCSLA